MKKQYFYGIALGIFVISTSSLYSQASNTNIICGSTFTDTGGENGNYSDDEDNITVISSSDGGNVTITFTEVEIEASPTYIGEEGGCWDYLTIYDGPTTSSPVLAKSKCGETKNNIVPMLFTSKLSIGDSFTSNNSSGSLTVRFRSDSSGNLAGWKAIVSCATLAVDESNVEKMVFAPNPTTGILKIASKQKIEKIEVYNSQGNQLIETTGIKNSEIDLSRFAPGVYLIKSKVNGKTFNNKVIKK